MVMITNVMRGWGKGLGASLSEVHFIQHLLQCMRCTLHIQMWLDFGPAFSGFDSVMKEGLTTSVNKSESSPCNLWVQIRFLYFLPTKL